jgi:hypothetical protein
MKNVNLIVAVALAAAFGAPAVWAGEPHPGTLAAWQAYLKDSDLHMRQRVEVFVPGGTMDGLLRVVHDYDNYQRVYRPVVTSSRTLASSETSQEFQMLWQRKIRGSIYCRPTRETASSGASAAWRALKSARAECI